jgi:glycosyltransferase involved in cell wall biosynthesis
VVDRFADPPVYGSTVIVYHWARLLRERGYSVDLLVTDEDPDPSWSGYLETHGIGTPALRVPRRPRWQMALALLRGESPSIARVRAEQLAEAIGAIAPAYDAVVAVGPSLLPLAERLRERHKVVFVPVDAVSLVVGTRLEHRWFRGVERLRWELELRLWQRLEERRFSTFDAVVFVAPADAEVASRKWSSEARRRIHVIPNGVDSSYFSPGTAPSEPDTLIFTGNLWSHDSVDAALWFIDEVLPRIYAVRPSVRLRLVGRDPAPSLLEAVRRDSRVVVYGNVPDLRPYLDAAAVYVCPLRTGAGVKNRLLEALAMGKATVATAACAEALHLTSEAELLTADSPEAFADATLRLLADSALRGELGAAGRRRITGHFSWEAGVERLAGILGAL